MTGLPAEDGIYSGISDSDYHRDLGSLSSSGARALLPPSCPAIFDCERRNPPNPKPEYDFGHGAHKLVLGEGSEIVEVPFDSWRSSEARAAREEAWAAAQVPLLAKDAAKARAMAEVVRAHPVARSLFDADGQPELSGVYVDAETGVRLKFRPDWLCQIGGQIICVDYKTSTSAHPGHFARAAADYGYHQQHAWYTDGLAATEIADDADFLFVVQSKTPPHLVSVVRIKPHHVDLGRRRNRKAIDLYAQCLAANTWPGFGDHIHSIEIPHYAATQQEQELIIA